MLICLHFGPVLGVCHDPHHISNVHAQVISTLLTFALIAGAGYVFLKSRGGKSTTDADEGGDDSLAAARRIMDKYK